MTNILIESYEEQPSFRLCERDFRLFASVKPIEIRARITKNITPEDMDWCDVLVDIRGGNPLSEYVVRQAKRAGKKVYMTLDDDLIASYPTNYSGKVFEKSLISVMKIVDGVLTCNKYLGDKYKGLYGINYAIFDTVIDKSLIKKNVVENFAGKTRLLYAAGAKHIPFFEKYIYPCLNKLHQRYGEGVTLTIIGPDINLDGVKLTVEKIPSMTFESYRSFMDSHKYDIGLAPLFDTEFCRMKYFNKYLEYSTNNICGIYSNVMPYTFVVKNGENGLLADNTADSWFDKICLLIDNEQLKSSIVINAKKHILNEFSLLSVVNKLDREIPDLFSYKSKQSKTQICKHIRCRYNYYALKRRFFLLCDLNK